MADITKITTRRVLDLKDNTAVNGVILPFILAGRNGHRKRAADRIIILGLLHLPSKTETNIPNSNNTAFIMYWTEPTRVTGVT